MSITYNIIKNKRNKYELVGYNHCGNGQHALYGIYDTIIDCYRESNKYNSEFKNAKVIIEPILLRTLKLKKIQNKL